MIEGTIGVSRIRGRALQRIRHRHLSQHPLCAHCLATGRPEPATQVDHILALCNGGTDTADNRQSLCTNCHRTKTALDKGYKPTLGCDANGLPLDPNHQWNSPGGASTNNPTGGIKNLRDLTPETVIVAKKTVRQNEKLGFGDGR